MPDATQPAVDPAANPATGVATVVATVVAPAAAKDAVASLAGQIPHLTTGQRAALRRLYLTRSPEAIGVVMGLLHKAGVPQTAWRDKRAFGRWCLLAHVAALLSGTGGVAAHAPGHSFGKALFAAGYSENRLLRLTTARGLALDDQLRRAARYLAQAGVAPVDLRTVRDLIGADPVRAERARFDLARDYYDAAHRSAGHASEGDAK